MTSSQLEELVQRLSVAFLNGAKDTGTNTKNVLLPPSSVGAIESFERDHNCCLPNSYKQFLLLHNGWKKFGNNSTVMGVTGPHTEQAIREFRKRDAEFVREWTTAGRSTEPAFVNSYESQSGEGETLEQARLYLPSLIKFGTNFTHTLYAFNPRRVDKAGEPEVLIIAFSSKIYRRDPNFYDFLRRTLEGYTARGY
jgi:hypothetical protein